MIIRLSLLAVMALSACGVDGSPQRPAKKAESGVTISGDARVGVSAQL
jgi:hypothetical protein